MDLFETSTEKQDEVRTLQAWNNTNHNFLQSGCIHELFEQAVQNSEQQTAVTYLDKKISYKLLNQRANQLAQLLRKSGVVRETLIGVSIEKGIDFVVGILGALKSGAVCVPLSPDYPDERINIMIADAKIKVILTNKQCEQKYQNFVGKIIVMENQQLETFPIENLGLSIYPDSLAYVFYTSGSTGQPKGVQITHGAVSNHMLWQKQKYFSTSTPVVLQKASYNFDASLWEIFLPLICQGKMVILPEEKTDDIYLLAEIVNKEKINAIELTPSAISLLLETKFFENDSLKWVFSSSEFLHSSIYNKFIQRNYNTKISVLYGPTEATIDAISYDCLKKKYLSDIPIGKPIANTQIYILDDKLNNVPLGDVGEIYIAGMGLARGYTDRGMTAKKFIPNPFIETLGNDKKFTRLYKTGDLGRHLSDGNIEFLGRVDRQIKLRGFRIELGEIENALLSLPDIQQALVLFKERVTRTGSPTLQYLVAYYKSRNKITEEQIVRYLGQILPDYMIPNNFIPLETFPLNKNGKLDVQSLSEPVTGKYGENYIAPRCEEEAMLCQIWQEALGIDEIGIEENFFHLGGNSLVCLAIQNKILEAFNISILSTDIYAGLTISNVYEMIRKKKVENISSGTSTSLNDLIAREEEKLFSFEESEKIIETKYGSVWTQLIYTNESKGNVPLILLHGGPSGSHDALRHLLPLCLNRPLLFFDQLGGGRSDTPLRSSVSDFDMFVDALAAIINAYNFDSYYLFGDCLSCTVIIKYVTTYRNKSKGVILSSPSISEELHDADLLITSRRMPEKYKNIIDYHRENDIYNSPELVEARGKFVDMFVLQSDKFTNYLKKAYLYIDQKFCERMAGKKGMFFPTEGTLQGVDVSDLLSKINTPVLITFGENDFVTEDHKKLLKKIKNSSTIAFENCAHWPLIEKTDEYMQVLNNWFDVYV